MGHWPRVRSKLAVHSLDDNIHFFAYSQHILSLPIISTKVNFMEMNLKTIRYGKPGDARPVVYQMDKSCPMEPRTL